MSVAVGEGPAIWCAEPVPMMDAMVLAANSVITATSSLPDPMLRLLQPDPDGESYVIWRSGSRAPAKLIDGQTASLLGQFREPVRVVEAVATLCARESLDPVDSMIQAYPLLRLLVREGFLQDAAVTAADPAVMLNVGSGVGDWTTTMLVQRTDDTEVYQARSPLGVGALKILRTGASARLTERFRRELTILEGLSGRVGPRLLDTGTEGGNQFMVLEWIDGIGADVYARHLARSGDRELQPSQVTLVTSLLDAFAALHERGVVHGDVHPRNILVDEAGEIRIIDFGWSHHEAGEPPQTRPGFGRFHEPEYAVAIENRQPPPAATPYSDQYSLAVLIYSLVAGRDYIDFPPYETALREEVARAPVRPLLRPGSPAVENVLKRALAKDPGARFPTLRAFRVAFLRAVEEGSWRGTLGPATSPLASFASAFFDPSAFRKLEAASLPRPRACVCFGAAGVAYSLYEYACATDDPAFLDLADLWSIEATRASARPGAFFESRRSPREGAVTDASLHYGASGVHCVRAIVTAARSDLSEQRIAVKRFVKAAAPPTESTDLVLGVAGSLIGTTLLLEAIPSSEVDARTAVRELGRGLADQLSVAQGAWDDSGSSTDSYNLGMAHGLAGRLFALLRWATVSDLAVPSTVWGWLAELEALGTPFNGGVRWPWLEVGAGGNPPVRYSPGWCNGTAGILGLWLAAYQASGKPRFLDLAVRSAVHVRDGVEPAATLCCGLAGRARAMLSLYRATGAAAHREAGCRLAEAAVLASEKHGRSSARYSLYRGDAGVAVVAQAALDPTLTAGMPLVDSPA